MTTLQSFGLTEMVARAITTAGYTEPTPVQARAIPLVMEGRDVLGIAQTGTGKTLAFAAPILHGLLTRPVPTPKRGARALVLAPTRELASQIAASFETYSKGANLRIITVFGGVKIGKQIRDLNVGAHVLVATPGRLLDLIDQRAVSLKDVEVLVLDEADQMMDLGFIHALRRIVPMLPKSRQTLFFSATMPKAISELAAQYLTHPAEVRVAPPATTAERVEQRIYAAPSRTKPALLVHLLSQPDVRSALVFSRTKHGADRIVRQLATAKIDAMAIHGNKSQPQRERALSAFRSGDCKVLIATDIAARGIDIGGLSHVINFDLPNVPDQYVHRIGRTARAGADGVAISLVDHAEMADLRQIERTTRQKFTPLPLPEGVDFSPIEMAPEAPEPVRHTRAPGGGQGRRPHSGPRPSSHKGASNAEGPRQGDSDRPKRRKRRPNKSANKPKLEMA